ncbi:MAG: thiamine pyrophosphate-binding protein [Acidobacteriota bacterium]
MSLACKNALTSRRVSHLVVPDEIQKQAVTADERPGDQVGRMMKTEISPPAESVESALQLLRASRRPVFIAGYGAIPAGREVVELAEILNCPVITTFKSKGLLPDSHPLACGVVGRSGTPVAARFMTESDCLVVMEAGFSAHSGISRNKPTIQVDYDPAALARFHPVTVPVWGEIGKTVELLKDSLSGNNQFEDRRAEIATEWKTWRNEKKRRSAADNGSGMSSAAVYEILGRVAPGDALITIDVGDNAYSFGRYFESDSQPVIMSGYLGSIGFSFPAAMGVWAASQDSGSEFEGRKVISVSGDGGFVQYMGEFLTAVKYGMNITHLLLNNNELGKIAEEQRDEDFKVWSTSLNNLNFADYAQSCGARGFRAGSIKDLEEALKNAIEYSGPSLVEVAVDTSLN